MINTDKLAKIKDELLTNVGILKDIHLHIKAIPKQSKIEQAINKCIKPIIKMDIFKHINDVQTEDELSKIWNLLYTEVLNDLFAIYVEQYDLIPTEIQTQLDKLNVRSSMCFDNAFLITSRAFMFVCEMPSWKLALAGMPIVVSNPDNEKSHAVSYKNYIHQEDNSFKHLYDYAFNIMCQLNK